jgi:serine protease Do
MLQQTPPEPIEAGRSVVSFGRGARRGCGFVIGQDRVVALSYRLRADTVETVFAGGERREGHVLGGDRSVGVAVLDVSTAEAPEVRWAPAPPTIGSAVFAIGDPGTGLRVTAGSVSADPLTVRSRDGHALQLIEHTAPLPRGSGGGPLVDGTGAVVGMNALRGDGGFLLALPARAVQDAVGRVIEGREPVRLGVALASVTASRRMRRAVGLPDRDGLLVQGVEDGGPADAAGVRQGDLLLSLAGVELKALGDLFVALDRGAGEETVALTVLRATDEVELSLDLRGDGGERDSG